MSRVIGESQSDWVLCHDGKLFHCGTLELKTVNLKIPRSYSYNVHGIVVDGDHIVFNDYIDDGEKSEKDDKWRLVLQNIRDSSIRYYSYVGPAYTGDTYNICKDPIGLIAISGKLYIPQDMEGMYLVVDPVSGKQVEKKYFGLLLAYWSSSNYIWFQLQLTWFETGGRTFASNAYINVYWYYEGTSTLLYQGKLDSVWYSGIYNNMPLAGYMDSRTPWVFYRAVQVEKKSALYIHGNTFDFFSCRAIAKMGSELILLGREFPVGKPADLTKGVRILNSKNNDNEYFIIDNNRTDRYVIGVYDTKEKIYMIQIKNMYTGEHIATVKNVEAWSMLPLSIEEKRPILQRLYTDLDPHYIPDLFRMITAFLY